MAGGSTQEKKPTVKASLENGSLDKAEPMDVDSAAVIEQPQQAAAVKDTTAVSKESASDRTIGTTDAGATSNHLSEPSAASNPEAGPKREPETGAGGVEAVKSEEGTAAKVEAGLGSKGSTEKLDENDKQIEAAEAAAAAAEEAAAEDTRAFMRRLLSYLEPRMLRRLKHNVSNELPPKITRKVSTHRHFVPPQGQDQGS